MLEAQSKLLGCGASVEHCGSWVAVGKMLRKLLVTFKKPATSNAASSFSADVPVPISFIREHLPTMQALEESRLGCSKRGKSSGKIKIDVRGHLVWCYDFAWSG